MRNAGQAEKCILTESPFVVQSPFQTEMVHIVLTVKLHQNSLKNMKIEFGAKNKIMSLPHHFDVLPC